LAEALPKLGEVCLYTNWYCSKVKRKSHDL